MLAGIILFGGMIKGMIGMGLPLITVAFGALILPVKIVLGLSMVSILLTNIWQVRDGGGSLQSLKRFWPMIATMVVFLGIGAQLITVLDGNTLMAILGVVIVVCTVLGLVRPQTLLPKRYELPVSLFAGAASGLSGGLSTVYGPPITMFLLMTDLKKEDYIGTTGLIWVFIAFPLVGFYYMNGIIHSGNIGYSMLACIPAMIGLWIGQRIRKKIPQEAFRKILLVTLLIIGANLIRRAVF